MFSGSCSPNNQHLDPYAEIGRPEKTQRCAMAMDRHERYRRGKTATAKGRPLPWMKVSWSRRLVVTPARIINNHWTAPPVHHSCHRRGAMAIHGRAPDVVDVADAWDAQLEGFRSLKHRKFSDQLLVEGLEAIQMLLTSDRFTCSEVLLQRHMLLDLLGLLDGKSRPRLVVCELAMMEAVTGISVPRSKSNNLAFALAGRPVDPYDLARLEKPRTRVVALDGLTDASNVGTIVKVAAAFGATAILLSSDCCDALSPRSIRVSAGHVFHVPLIQGDLVAMLQELNDAEVLTMAAIVQEAKFLDEVPQLPPRWALVLGSEHHGVRPDVRSVCRRRLKVRMAEGVDSLNVMTSAGVLIHGCVERERRAIGATGAPDDPADDDSVAAKLAARYAAAASLAQRQSDMEALFSSSPLSPRFAEWAASCTPETPQQRKAPRVKPMGRENGGHGPTTPSEVAKEVFATRLRERTPSNRLQLRMSRTARPEVTSRRLQRSASPPKVTRPNSFRLISSRSNPGGATEQLPLGSCVISELGELERLRFAMSRRLDGQPASQLFFISAASRCRARVLRTKMESLISDGRYTPGKMKQIRDKAAGKLFLQRPSVKQKVMKSPASYKWQQEGRLDFQDRIGDGFAARYSKELLVLDAEVDWRLRDFVEEVQVALHGVLDQRQAIVLVSDMIQKTLGGLGSKVQNAFQKRIQDLKLPAGDSLYIGELMAGAQAGYMGSGMCRHRCLLFKYLAGRLKVCDCAAITGVIVPNDCQNVSKFRKENGFADHAWNIVRLEGRNYLLDVMNMPKQLQSLNSADGEKVQMKVHGASYVYYRYDGGSGISLAFSPDPSGDAFDSRSESEDFETDCSEDQLDPNCFLEQDEASGLTLIYFSWISPGIFFCRTTRRAEPIVELHTVDLGRVLVEFDMVKSGRRWQARKLVPETHPSLRR
eukprot:s193_g30.t1